MAEGITARKPPAFKHGLASRWVLEIRADETSELADHLIGSSPREPAVMAAAQRAAEAILHLRNVKAVKMLAFREAVPDQATKACLANFSPSVAASFDAGRAVEQAVQDEALNQSDRLLLEFLRGSEGMLRRLEEYERRALSLRSKAIRELDLVRIEIERGSIRRP